MDQGGLGVPNLLFYHYAFSLRHLVHWALPPERAPPWFGLESPLCNPLPPMHYITTKLSLEAQSHPIISHLQWVWKRMAFIFNFNANLHTAASIWTNPKLCIGKSPFLWKPWVDRGLLTLWSWGYTQILFWYQDTIPPTPESVLEVLTTQTPVTAHIRVSFNTTPHCKLPHTNNEHFW